MVTHTVTRTRVPPASAGIARALRVDPKMDPQSRGTHGIFTVADDAVATLAAFDAETFDYITMISVLEHLPDPQIALDGIHRVLAPGGTASVHVSSRLCKPVLAMLALRRGTSADTVHDHGSYYRITELRSMAVHAGFLPVHTHVRYTLLGFVLRANLRKPSPSLDLPSD
jgi:2-polyprenyl-3-methyl-5-hydroxy-6-metoxy-1,4-benzoquinol methylase